MQVDAYIRVSDVHGRSGESFISVDVQRERITAWAASQGHEIIEYWEELDVSGGKMQRPKLDEVMRRIESGQTQGVVVWRLDRFARTLVGALELIKTINDRGALFASVSESFDITTPSGRLVLNMMLSLAQFELERIAESWKEARRRAADRGVHMGAAPPFGYRKREDGRLEPDPVTGPAVTEIFQRRAAGQSWTVINRWFATLGHEKAGLGHFSRLVGRDVYAGVITDATSGVRHEGAHAPLVDKSTFQAAQDRRGARFAQGDSGTLLRGLVRCSGCRYSMNVGRESYNGVRSHNVYRCSRRERSLGCVCPARIPATSFVSRGRTRLGLDDYVTEAVKAKVPELIAEAYGTGTDLTDLELSAENAENDLHVYATDLELEKAIGRDAWRVGFEARQQAFNEAQKALEDARGIHGADLQRTLRFLDDFETLSLDQKRGAIGQVVRAVFVRDIRPGAQSGTGRKRGSRANVPGASADSVHIVWVDDPQVDIPRQGRRNFNAGEFVFPGDANEPGDVREAVS